MKNSSKLILIMAVTLLLSMVGMASAATDFDDRYHDLRSEYSDLTERYTDYRSDYLNHKEYYDYNEYRYDRNLRELRGDFYALERDADNLIEDIRDADGSDSLADDVRDLKDDAQSFQDRIDDLLNSEDYTYDHYGYLAKEVPKSVPEPKVTVQPLSVYVQQPTKQASAEVVPSQDRSLIWLGAGIVVIIALIMFLLALLFRKK